MPAKRYRVRLSVEEQQNLKGLVSRGRAAALDLAPISVSLFSGAFSLRSFFLTHGFRRNKNVIAGRIGCSFMATGPGWGEIARLRIWVGMAVGVLWLTCLHLPRGSG